MPIWCGYQGKPGPITMEVLPVLCLHAVQRDSQLCSTAAGSVSVVFLFICLFDISTTFFFPFSSYHSGSLAESYLISLPTLWFNQCEPTPGFVQSWTGLSDTWLCLTVCAWQMINVFDQTLLGAGMVTLDNPVLSLVAGIRSKPSSYAENTTGAHLPVHPVHDNHAWCMPRRQPYPTSKQGQ